MLTYPLSITSTGNNTMTPKERKLKAEAAIATFIAEELHNLQRDTKLLAQDVSISLSLSEDGEAQVDGVAIKLVV